MAVVNVIGSIAALGFLAEVAVAVIIVSGLAQQYAFFGEAVVGVVFPTSYVFTVRSAVADPVQGKGFGVGAEQGWCRRLLT